MIHAVIVDSLYQARIASARRHGVNVRYAQLLLLLVLGHRKRSMKLIKPERKQSAKNKALQLVILEEKLDSNATLGRHGRLPVPGNASQLIVAFLYADDQTRVSLPSPLAHGRCIE